MSIPRWILTFNLLKQGSRLVSQSFETYKNLRPFDKAYWNSTLVSTAHAIVLFQKTYTAIRNAPYLLVSSSLNDTTDELSSTLDIFVGYLMYDLVGVVRFFNQWRGSRLMLVHHLSALFVWIQMIYLGKGHSLAMYGHLCEFTTPFINNRWFFEQFHKQNGNMALLNSLIIFVLWIIFRIGLFGYSGLKLVQQLYTDWDNAPMFFSLSLMGNFSVGYYLQWKWFLKMVRILVRMLKSTTDF